MKKVLITGGAGFIGYHLTKFLLENTDFEITIVDNLVAGKLDESLESIIANNRVNLLKLDVSFSEELYRLDGGYDYVYHLAAINGTKNFYEIPHETLRVNTLGLINILEWFKEKNRDGKFCFTSSNEAYAGGLNAFGVLPIPTPENVPLVIDDPYNPRWSYGGSKLIGELFVINYAEKYNLNALIVRPHNFYGPRAGYGHVIPDFCLRVINQIDPFPIFGAEDTRTFCYIDDAVKAMHFLMINETTNKRPIETVHIGDTREVSIKDLASILFNVVGWEPKSLRTQPSPKGSVRRRLADITKLQSITGWNPEVSLEEGLLSTFNWYEKHPRP